MDSEPKEVVPEVYETDLEKIMANWNRAMLEVLETRLSVSGESMPKIPEKELVEKAPYLLERVTTPHLESGKGDSHFIVLTGPSGVGKGTIGKLLGMDKFPRITTRDPRPGEIDGVDYHFLSQEEFEKRKRQGDFLWDVWNRDIGRAISKGDLEERIKSGRPFWIDAGAESATHFTPKAKEAGLKPLLVFLLPPSYEELYRRLMGRVDELKREEAAGAVEDEQEINKRLNIAPVLMRRTAESVDAYIVNDTPERAASKIARNF